MIFTPLKMKFFGNISENTHDITILMTFLDSLDKTELKTTVMNLQ